MSVPRRHHSVPVCYLKGFTAENSKNGRLHVFNMQSGKRFSSSPRKVCSQRDLYKADVPEGDDAFFIERGISEAVEGPFANVMASIASRGTLPRTPHDWNALLTFIAFQAARVPSTLDASRWLSSEVAKESLRATSQDAAKFEEIKKRASEAGEPWEGTREDLIEEVRRLDAGDLKMIPSPNLQLHLMFVMMEDLRHMIAERRWRLLIADDEAPDLICSDRPFISTGPHANPLRDRFDTWLRGAHLTFPLTRRMWLISIGRFDSEGVRKCGPMTVVAANRRIALYANRFVFSSNPVFMYKEGKKLRDSSDLAQLLKHRERMAARACAGLARS